MATPRNQNKQILVPWRAQPGPQLEAIQKAWVYEILYGGARGGGKTAYLLGDFAQEVPQPGGESWHGILFRRTLPQLDDVIRKSQTVYPMWFGKNNVEWRASDKMWVWKNGATLKMRYAEAEDDWIQYHGHEYTWLGFDELTTWPTPELYMKLKATLRSPNPLHKFKRIRATANPGGPGHNWVREYFGIDRYPLGSKLLVDERTKKTRMYIKARVTDNKILLAAQPDYPDTLKGVGSEATVTAWLAGEWDVVLGAYFTEFSTAKHVILPVEIPPTWTRIRMMDWGGASPFAVLWGAISDGTPLWDGQVFPKGAMLIYREWYGASRTDEGRWAGLKMRTEDIAAGIMARETAKDGSREHIDDSVIDPAAYAQHGGPSIAETFARVSNGDIMFRRGDNQRIPGWSAIRDRLVGGPFGPMLYIFNTCTHLIRTLPALPHDANKPEDVDTDAEDHAPDALRYGCMSRPWTRVVDKPRSASDYGVTLDELWKNRERELRRI